MLNFLLVIDVLIAIGLIVLILLQRGPGATAGAAFGSGASGTVFGARGSANFLTRATGVLATGFFVVTLAMAMIASRQVESLQQDNLGVMSNVTEEVADDPLADEALQDAVNDAVDSGPAAGAAGVDAPTGTEGAAAAEGDVPTLPVEEPELTTDESAPEDGAS